MGNLSPFFNKKQTEAGCDEAGRGCLAGPVSAAAVILPHDFHHPLLNDSKKMTEKQRELLRPIIEREAIAWQVCFIDHEEIDRINILNASILGMQRAALNLAVKPDFLLIDGNRFHAFEIPHACFVKGDGRFMSIAAASVLAKTHRDEFMEVIHAEHPVYQWSKNKGYPTVDHRNAVKEFGFSPYHRRTFQIKDLDQLQLNFE